LKAFRDNPSVGRQGIAPANGHSSGAAPTSDREDSVWKEFETPVASMAARRERMQDELEARADEIDRLSTLLDESKARIRELERRAAHERTLQRALQSDLEAERLARERLQTLLDAKTGALVTARSELAQVEDDWFDLYAELQELQARHAAVEQALAASREDAQEQRDRAERMAAAEEAINRWALSLQEKVADLERQVSDGGVYVSDLLSRIEQHEEELARSHSALTAKDQRISDLEGQVSAGGEYVAELLSKLSQLEADLARTRSELAESSDYVAHLLGEISAKEQRMSRIDGELEAIRKAAVSEQLVMREYAEALHQKVADLSARVAESERERDSHAQALDAVRKELAEQSATLESSTANEAALAVRLAEVEQQLVEQAEAFCEQAQAEAAQVSTMIDIVQSSRFWKIKRWLSRLRVRAFGMQ
jgi:chromosome segregation ATPase